MNRVELHNEPSYDDLGCRTFSLKGSARFAACAVVILMATWAPSVLADAQVYGYVGPTGLVGLTNVPTDEACHSSSPQGPVSQWCGESGT